MAGRPDVAGALLGASGLAGVTYALIEAPSRGIASAPVLLAAVIGVVALVAFCVAERRIRHPMLPLDIFESRQFSAANAVTFLEYADLSGVFFLLIVHLQTVLGYSALRAGALPCRSPWSCCCCRREPVRWPSASARACRCRSDRRCWRSRPV